MQDLSVLVLERFQKELFHFLSCKRGIFITKVFANIGRCVDKNKSTKSRFAIQILAILKLKVLNKY